MLAACFICPPPRTLSDWPRRPEKAWRRCAARQKSRHPLLRAGRRGRTGRRLTCASGYCARCSRHDPAVAAPLPAAARQLRRRQRGVRGRAGVGAADLAPDAVTSPQHHPREGHGRDSGHDPFHSHSAAVSFSFPPRRPVRMAAVSPAVRRGNPMQRTEQVRPRCAPTGKDRVASIASVGAFTPLVVRVTTTGRFLPKPPGASPRWGIFLRGVPLVSIPRQ